MRNKKIFYSATLILAIFGYSIGMLAQGTIPEGIFKQWKIMTQIFISHIYEIESGLKINLHNNTSVTGNLEVSGTVDGRDVSTDGSTLDSHVASTSNPHSVTKTQVGLGNVENLKVKLDATTAPGVGDDSADGYAVGSRWVDITADKEYVCLDASTGAAIWTETTAGALPVVDTVEIVKGSADATKKVRFEVDGVTTGATRVMTIPDKDITFADNADLTTHTGSTSNPHSVTKTQVGLGNVADLKVKLDATAAPGTGDDTVDGYAPGSIWVDVTNDKAYICLDATEGAAVWTETTQAASNLAFSDLTDVPASYTGQGGKYPRVKATEDGLEYATPAGAGDMVLATEQTVTGAKTFNDAKLVLAGATSGTTVLKAAAEAGTNTVTLPAATDTVVCKATTDTLTNKTLSTGTVISEATISLGSDADGDMYYRTSGKLTRVPKGTAGQVWIMNSGATAPEWSNGGTASLYIDAGAMLAATTNGATSGSTELATNKQMIDYFDFDASTEKYVQFKLTAPGEWDRSTIKVKFYWTNGEASGSGNVIWGIQSVAVSNDDALDASWGTAQEVTDGIIADGDNHVTAATSAMTVGGTPAADDMILFRIYRKAADGSDTYDKKARLLGIAIQYGKIPVVAW